MPTITIPTVHLDQLIAEGFGEITISDLREAQLTALPFECPQCEGDGEIEVPGAVEGEVIETTCPLCGGMGKLSTEHTLVIDASHYAPVTT